MTMVKTFCQKCHTTIWRKRLSCILSKLVVDGLLGHIYMRIEEIMIICFSELLEFFKVKNFNRVTVSGVTKCENSDANWWKFSLILDNQSFFIIFQLKLICWVIFNNFLLHPCRNVVLRAVFACVNAVWKVWVC